MSKTANTVATAPRDLDTLKTLGAFNLKTLALELELFGADDQKARMAFSNSSIDQRAELVLAALENHDKNCGKDSAKKVKRQPANKGVKADAPTDAPITSPTADTGSKLAALLQQVCDAQTQILDRLENLEVSVEEQRELIAGVATVASVSTMVTLMVGESTLGAGRHDILNSAIEERGDLEAALGEVMGDAEGDAEGEE